MNTVDPLMRRRRSPGTRGGVPVQDWGVYAQVVADTRLDPPPQARALKFSKNATAAQIIRAYRDYLVAIEKAVELFRERMAKVDPDRARHMSTHPLMRKLYVRRTPAYKYLDEAATSTPPPEDPATVTPVWP